MEHCVKIGFPCVVAMAAFCLMAGGTEVKVSSFGYDAEDSTRFVQKALDSGAPKVVLDRQAGPWNVLPLKMRSNTELVLEPGVELVAKRGAYKGLRDFLLELACVSNVVVRGGEGSTLRMWKTDYQGPDYKHGEWRYALRLHHVTNVVVEGLHIVESGGDGIGVTGKDIVIRKCVCDRNHRQGISVFNAENLLIEDCVLSNTDGTAPMSGIDIEPDTNRERLVNVTLRNVLSCGNSGCGFQLHLVNLDMSCPPVSIRFENCRSVGNRTAAHVMGAGHRENRVVKGLVEFVDCSFESPGTRAITLSGVTRDTFDVAFRNCVASNGPPRNADVQFGTTKIQLGSPEGITLDNLVIHQSEPHDWFTSAGQGIGPVPSRIAGAVKIVAPDGVTRTETLDAVWAARHFPPANGGRPLPARAALPKVVKVIDAAPGEFVDLAPLSLLGREARYVFYLEKPGLAKFRGRQICLVKGRPFGTKPFTVTALGADGRPGRKWKIPMIGGESTEFAFEAPKAGFYRLARSDSGTRFALERSTVPVAVDVLEDDQLMAPVRGKPFSLWFEACGGNPFALVARGDSYYRFRMSVVDPSGATRGSVPVVKDLQVLSDEAPATGLWRADFARAAEPHYDWVRFDLFGAPGTFFLSREKIWTTKQD